MGHQRRSEHLELDFDVARHTASKHDHTPLLCKPRSGDGGDHKGLIVGREKTLSGRVHLLKLAIDCHDLILVDKRICGKRPSELYRCWGGEFSRGNRSGYPADVVGGGWIYEEVTVVDKRPYR